MKAPAGGKYIRKQLYPPHAGGGIPDSGDTGPGNKDRTGDLYLHPADYDCTEPDEDDRAV